MPPASVRLDVWLDVACLYRTRSEAQKACKGGKVDLNGHAARQNREIRPGDVIELSRPHGRRQRVVVVATADRHVPRAEARALYEDTTPPPSPEEQAMLELIRLAAPKRRGPDVAPERDERRRLRRDKERW